MAQSNFVQDLNLLRELLVGHRREVVHEILRLKKSGQPLGLDDYAVRFRDLQDGIAAVERATKHEGTLSPPSP
jgi:hypothetical protein